MTMKTSKTILRLCAILCALQIPICAGCSAPGDPFVRTTEADQTKETPSLPEETNKTIYSAVRSLSSAEAEERYGNPRIGVTDALYEYQKYLFSGKAHNDGGTLYFDEPTVYTLGKRARGSVGPFEPVCLDPICKHSVDSACPFAGVLSFVIDRDNVIFVTQIKVMRAEEDYEEYKLKRYDMKSGKTTELYRTIDDRIAVATFEDGKLFLCVGTHEELKSVVHFYPLCTDYTPAAEPFYTIDKSNDEHEQVVCIYKNKVLSLIDSEDSPGSSDLILVNTDTLAREVLCRNYQFRFGTHFRMLFDKNKVWLDKTMEILDLDTLERTKTEGKWAMQVTDCCIVWVSYEDTVERAKPGDMQAGNGRPYILTFENYLTGETDRYTINKGGFFTYGADYLDGMIVVCNQPYVKNDGSTGMIYEAFIDPVTGKWQFTLEDTSDEQDFMHPELYILHDPEELTQYTAKQLYGE